MQLIEIDPINPKPPQASLTRRTQVRWAPVGVQLPRPLADGAALGRHDQVSADTDARRRRGLLRSARGRRNPRCRRAGLQDRGPAKEVLRGWPVRRFSPAARAGQGHRPVADAAYGQVAADREGRGRQAPIFVKIAIDPGVLGASVDRASSPGQRQNDPPPPADDSKTAANRFLNRPFVRSEVFSFQPPERACARSEDEPA